MITVVLLNCVVVRQTDSGQFTNTSINYPYVTNNRPRMSHPSFSLHGVREEVRVNISVCTGIATSDLGSRKRALITIDKARYF